MICIIFKAFRSQPMKLMLCFDTYAKFDPTVYDVQEKSFSRDRNPRSRRTRTRHHGMQHRVLAGGARMASLENRTGFLNPVLARTEPSHFPAPAPLPALLVMVRAGGFASLLFRRDFVKGKAADWEKTFFYFLQRLLLLALLLHRLHALRLSPLISIALDKGR